MRNILCFLTALSLSSIVSSLFLFSSFADPPSQNQLLRHLKRGLGRDHAVLEPDQSVKVQEFVQRLFFDQDGLISLDKLNLLLEVLHEERERLLDDMYESKILEKVEVDVFSQEKARSIAEKKKLTPNNQVAVYDSYLIPTIEILKDLVERGERPDEWDGYIHDFIRGYHVFRSPNSHPTAFPQNVNGIGVVKGVFARRHFKKEDRNRKEAINLIVEEENIDDIQSCLPSLIRIGHYLTQTEIRMLKACRFDVSRINPGLSPLWERRTPEELDEFMHRDPTLGFPAEDATLAYKEVMLSGAASPKIEVKDKATGLRYKVKWGVEAHVDNAIGNISFLLGYDIDSMLYRKEVKVHLGKKSYTQMMSQLQAKYGQEAANHTVLGRGGMPGDEWVILKDVMLEARPEDDAIRTTAFDPTVMDFHDRREFNGRLLLNAFVSLIDNKISNMKMLLGPRQLGQAEQDGASDPRPRIIMRMKDLGDALGPAFQITQFRGLFAIGSKYIPELFDNKGIVLLNKEKDTITVKWSDLGLLTGLYEHASYLDLKWMARKIAALSGDTLEWCLLQAGVPAGPAKLYRAKLISRRNEIIEAFELKDDPNFTYPEENPDIGLNYQGDEPDGRPQVTEGRIARGHFDGKQIYLKNKSTVLYRTITAMGNYLNGLISALTLSPGMTSTLANQLTLSPQGFLQGVGAGTAVNLHQTFDANQLSTPMLIKLGIGVTASIARQVLISTDLHTDSDSKARPYFVRDTAVFTVGLGTPPFQNILPFLPFELGASIKFFEAAYEYDHYTEEYLPGFITSPLPFLKSLVQPIEEASKRLDRMEVIRRSLSYGVEVAGQAGIFNYYSLIPARTAGSAGRVKLDDRSYFRDQFGHLHVLTQKTHETYSNVVHTAGEVYNPVIFRSPLVGHQKNDLAYRTEQVDYVAEPHDQIEYSNETPIRDNDGRLKNDLVRLRAKRVDEAHLEHFQVNFRIKSEGKSLFFENIGLEKGVAETKQISSTEVTYPDGHLKKLTLRATQRDNYIGIASERTIVPMMNLFVKNAQRFFLNIEIDDYDPANSIILIRMYDYIRKGNRSDVQTLIDSFNRRFSINPETPLFREYELPPAEEVDEYRKIYGVLRVYVRLNDFLDQIVALESKNFRSLAENFIGSNVKLDADTSSANPGALKRIAQRFRIKSQAGSLARLFKKLKTEAMKLNRNFSKIAELVDQFISKVEIQKLGTSLIQQMIGEDSIFVSCAMEGIYPSFSVAGELQERQRRRFAGKSWGKLDMVAPVQYHNRYERILYSSDLVPIQITQDTIFGHIQSGWPVECQTVYQNPR